MQSINPMVIKPDLAQKISQAPKTPGVYIFKTEIGEVLYVGKAINLFKRLQYYAKNREDLYAKTAKFLEQTQRLDWIEVSSELEAILLEINLIRTLKPKYNIINRDDKRPLYVHITNDDLPRIQTARVEIAGTGEYIGPFPSSYKLKQVLKGLRRVFPYCSCSGKRKNPCMFVDLGLCSPSPTQIKTTAERKAYLKNISRLRLFLNGKVKRVIKLLQKEMNHYAQKMEYEKAQVLKNQIKAIEDILTAPPEIAPYLTDALVSADLRRSQLQSLENFMAIPGIERIEGYDIANTSGTNPTASMVVFEMGFPNTSEYRKFKITRVKGPNDPLMIYDTLKRRFNHPEWDFPQVMLIDGGKTQVKAAGKALKESGIKNIKIIGLAKRFEQLVIPKEKQIEVVTPPLDMPYLTLLRAVRDEAHRFTTTYHKKLRQREMLGKMSNK